MELCDMAIQQFNEYDMVCSDDLIEKTKQVVKLLQNNNIHHWLYGGILLGWYRTGEPLSWEKDIDLFVWEEDFQKVIGLSKEFKKLGLTVIYKENSIALKWDCYEIGVQFYYQDYSKAICPNRLVTQCKFDNMIYFGLLSKACKYRLKRTFKFFRWVLLTLGRCYTVTQVVPIEFFTQLQEIDLFGLKILVPLDLEGFFEHTFGKDWRIPKKEFTRPRKYYVRGGLTNARGHPKAKIY